MIMRCQYADQIHKEELQPTLDAAIKFGFLGKTLTADDPW